MFAHQQFYGSCIATAQNYTDTTANLNATSTLHHVTDLYKKAHLSPTTRAEFGL